MDYATAVQVLRDSGQTVNLVVKRRVVLPPPPPTAPAAQQQVQVEHDVKVSLSRGRKSKEDFGVILGCKIYVKEIVRRSPADRDGVLKEGDVVCRLNGHPADQGTMTLKEARKIMEAAKDRLEIVVRRERTGKKTPSPSKTVNGTYGQQQPPPLVRPGENPTPPRPPLPGANEVIDDGKKLEHCMIPSFARVSTCLL